MAEKKSPEKKVLNKGECLTCEVCGLSVTIDENHAYKEDTTLVCCGQSMKPRARKAAAAKK